MKALAILLMISPAIAEAARYQGKPLAFEQFSATLELDNGRLIEGKVTFKEKRNATLVSLKGQATNLTIKPECAKGPELDVDECWPRLKVDIDDKKNPRTGTLRIY